MGSVAIIGMGFVGTATAKALGNHYALTGYDIAWPAEKRDRRAVNKCDLAFVCVPTEGGADGHLQADALDDVLSWVDTPIIAIRSTIPLVWKPPKRKNIVLCPELIGETSFHPFRDERAVPFALAGCRPGDEIAAQQVLDLWKPVLGPEKKYYLTTWEVASKVKYGSNCWLSMKIAWMNEFLSRCERPDEVRNILCDLPWIASYATLPLGPIGGKCLPKDMRSWQATYGGPLAKAILRYVEPEI